MNRKNFFPSNPFQVILLLIISFVWIFFIVQFDLNYMIKFSLGFRTLIETFLFFIGPLMFYYLINKFKKRDTNISFQQPTLYILLTCSIVVISVVTLFVSIIKFSDGDSKFFNPYTTNNLWMLIAIGLVGPVFEELIFRAIIQRGLLQTLKPYYAVIISSILFMLVHHPNQYALAICLSLFFGFIYYKTNNIILPILLHLIANNFSTFIQFLQYKFDTVTIYLPYVGIILFIVSISICLKKQVLKRI